MNKGLLYIWGSVIGVILITFLAIVISLSTVMMNNTLVANAQTFLGNQGYTAYSSLIGDWTVPGNANIAGTTTIGSLTSGRIPYASTGGLLADSANLQFDGTTFKVATANITTFLMGNGLQLNQSATVYNITMTPPNEIRVAQNNPYNGSQYPLWQIQQLGTGESAFRIFHSDDTGSSNWLFGQLGRTWNPAGVNPNELPDNTIHRDFYLWQDGKSVVFSSKYAADTTSGRTRFGGYYWDINGSATARLESWSANVSEIAFIAKGYTGQTANILSVQTSDNTEQFWVSPTQFHFTGYANGQLNMGGQDIIGLGTLSRGDSTLTIQGRDGLIFKSGVTNTTAFSVTAEGGTSHLQFDIPPLFSNNATGSTTANLGTLSPASTVTPYAWVTVKTSDNSTVYIPVWK